MWQWSRIANRCAPETPATPPLLLLFKHRFSLHCISKTNEIPYKWYTKIIAEESSFFLQKKILCFSLYLHCDVWQWSRIANRCAPETPATPPLLLLFKHRFSLHCISKQTKYPTNDIQKIIAEESSFFLQKKKFCVSLYTYIVTVSNNHRERQKWRCNLLHGVWGSLYLKRSNLSKTKHMKPKLDKLAETYPIFTLLHRRLPWNKIS